MTFRGRMTAAPRPQLLPPEEPTWVQSLRRFAHGDRLNRFITFVILLAGVVVGAQTYEAAMRPFAGLLDALEFTIIAIFVVEVVIKIAAEGAKPWNYFRDGWNVFDFVIVVACVLPINASFAAVLRLVRILRVLRLVRALPKLRVLAGALIKSIPSMAYVGILLLLLFYIYAVAATFLFGHNDPIHFRNLQLSMVSLFRVVTLEDWTDIMYIQMYGCDHYGYGGDLAALCVEPKAFPVFGALFFVSFVLMGTMIILNLFIGVILNGMNEAQQEAEAEQRALHAASGGATIDDEFLALEHQFDALKTQLVRLHRRANKEP